MSGVGESKDSLRRKSRRMDERGDALGLLGRDGARKNIRRQQQIVGVFGKLDMWCVAVTQEDRCEAQMAAHGLGDQVLAFDGDEPARVFGQCARALRAAP